MDADESGIYRLANQMDCTNQDVFGENCIRNDASEIALNDDEKMNAWVAHYARLLNVEFDWPSHELPDAPR